jgi:hypothetical protein
MAMPPSAPRRTSASAMAKGPGHRQRLRDCAAPIARSAQIRALLANEIHAHGTVDH